MADTKVLEKEEVGVVDTIDNSTESIILYKGIKHDNVKELKSNLNRLGFGNLKVDLVFGDFTEQKVKMFQSYYGLEVTGVADLPTLDKIEELLNSPYQLHKSHDKLIPLKQKLNWIGYGNIKVTNYFGEVTDRQVKKFQKDYNLPVNGILDDLTIAKIDETLSDIYKPGNEHEVIAELKRNLNRLGFKGIKVSDSYGSFLEKRVKEFQSFYGLPVTGQANYETLNEINDILNSPLQIGKRHKDTIILKETLFTLGYGYVKNTNKFGKATEKEVKRFQRDYDLPESGIADKVTLSKIREAINFNEKVSYIQYPVTLDEALELQMNAYPQISDSVKSFSKNAEKTDVAVYLNPITFINDKKQKFQFLNLSKAQVVGQDVLNKFLDDKGNLMDLGTAFIEAGVSSNVNELFLVSLALIETNNGSSILAKGIPVNNKGEITFVKAEVNGKKRVEPGVTDETVKVVYNILGMNDNLIHNIDESAKKAFEENWDTPQKAIIGGAELVKDKFLGSYNTFYDMRWQPKTMSESGELGGVVSKDIDWASKQVSPIYNLYQELDSYHLYLDIPVYKDQPEVKYKRS
ncbi:peptidoglycan-binding protein [Oceanobacillus sp. J11TS1]|uniref:peptidoglycan-binding protein n=1 Tax=Oceanobacillus sp. J11TS1 TaxID=2807191 RepID=UPI001B129897|nr:peptidoglycan-binding protein [Oceanobacillus sp. J11TS1]GIO23431.1 hypothetical protein J11TS1_20120 [Oceanobacillus sp. J11TS1]